MSDRLDDVIDSSIAALIGIVLLCAAVIPISIEFIGSLTGDAAEYAPLLGLVLVVTILGLVIGIVRFYEGGGSRKEGR